MPYRLLMRELEALLTDPKRLAELDQLAILDTPPEAAFDDLTQAAADALRAPMALVSLVDGKRQFFKSAVGLTGRVATERETPLSHSFCKYVVAAQAPLMVDDARTDPAFRDHAAVQDESVGSYLGVPLTASTGACIGTFCVVDTSPRVWTDEDLALVQLLAKAAMTQVELRVALRSKHRQFAAGQEALEGTRRRFHRIYGHTREQVVILTRDGGVLFANTAFCELAGWEPDAIVGADVFQLLVVEDADRLKRFHDSVCASPGAVLHEEFRVLAGGRWMDRAITAANWSNDPTIGGVVVTARDITEQRRAERQLRQLQKMDALGRMAAGVSHDINNLLTTMYGAIHVLGEGLAPDDPRSGDLQTLRDAAESWTRCC